MFTRWRSIAKEGGIDSGAGEGGGDEILSPISVSLKTTVRCTLAKGSEVWKDLARWQLPGQLMEPLCLRDFRGRAGLAGWGNVLEIPGSPFLISERQS